MKKSLIINLVFFFSFILASCSYTSKNNNYGESNSTIFGEIVDDNEDINLTCIAHNDNVSYNEWKNLIYQDNGSFKYYDNFYPLYTNNRLTIISPKGLDVEISLLNDDNQIVYTAIPDLNGVCYLFPNWYSPSYNVLVKYYQIDTLLPVEQIYRVSNKLELTFVGNEVLKDTIDLMFVIDTTASMGDELAYLKNEIFDVVDRVSSFNSCSINVAILLYKDRGEIYETMYSEFTSNINDQLLFLENKIAYGGSDYEECVDVAMEEAASKQWSASNSTKILIHIGDAPAHDDDINKWYNAVLDLCGKGIRLITVGSSGLNKKTEYLFRSMTLISNGTYVALTNHSGVGEEHIDSSIISEYEIEYLDNCLVRLISGYHTGIFYDPVPIN